MNLYSISRYGRKWTLSVSIAVGLILNSISYSGNVCAQGYTNSFLYSFNPAVSKISFTPATRQGLFGESDTITISTSDNSPIRVMAIDGTLVYSGTPTALQLARGHYFVECNGDRSQFVVLPSDYQGASFLGVDAADGTDSVYTQRLAQIQPTWVRALTEGQWPVVEPSPGVWNWSTLDQTVAANAGRKIVVTAFIRPGWVTNNFLPQFLTYVTAMAQRYNGRIYAIQIWNEPWYSTVTANGLAWGDIGNAYTGNPAVDLPVFYQTLATLISSSRAAIQGVSPSMQVVGPDWQSPEDCNMTQPVMSLLGSQPMNIFSFHANTWTSPDGLTSSGSNGFAELTDLFLPYIGTLPWIVSEFHPFGTSALGIPTSGAEPGVPSPGFDWRRGMDRLTKTVVMWRAAGAQAIMPQVLPICAATLTNNWEDYGVEYGPGSYGRGPHPKTSAYLMSGYWLNNATFVDSRTPGQQVYLYAWKQPDNSSLVFAWTTEGITAPLLSTSSFNTLNLFGKTTQITALSEDPTLFTSTTLSPSALMDSILAALTQNYSVPPVWQPVNSQSVQIGQSLQFSVSAIDSNNAPITYSATGLPAGATLDPISGTFTWTPTSGQIGSYQVNFTATDDQGRSASTSTTIYVVGNLLDGLTHYWKFDEASGTNTADSVGQANGVLQNFSFSSPYGWVPGIEGTALSFNGAGASVLLPLDSVSLTNNFTLAAWVLPRNATGDTSFLSIQCNYRIGGLRLFIANNSLQVQGQTPAGWQGNVFATNAIQNGVWSHVIVVYDKSTVLVYLNGVYQGSAAWGGDLVMDPTGYTQFGTQGSYYFDGSLDDIMLFSRPLGPQEALDLYEAPLLPPTFSPITTQTVEPGQTVAFTLSATDVSGNQMTYSALSLPAGASFTASTQGFTWTPTSGQLGNSTATFVASDGWLTTTQQVLIVVTDSTQTDTTPPTLAVTSPGNYQVFTNSVITVTGSATDASGIKGVTVNGAAASVNGNNWSAPCSLAPGTNAITVIATDNSSNMNTASQVVYAVYNSATNSTQPDTTPPTLAVTGPANYQVFTNSAITVTGSATDASGIKGVTVNGVVASVNGNNFSAPYSLAPGTNAITVIATDNSSNMNTASQVVYAVYNSASSPPPNPGPVITTAPTITNAMLQVGNLAVVVAGDTNEFTVGATEPNGGTLNYTWMFGDDATSSPTQVGTASYVYTANCGPYTASVTVDDGTYSTNASFTVAIACQLTVSQLQGTLNFAKTNADTATIKATFALPADFSFTGQLVTLNIGGAQTSFTMDSKGRGLNGLSRFNKPSFNKKTGLWTFNAMLRNGSWHTPWAAYGLINATILKPGVSVTPPVILVIGDESFMAIPTRQYTSQAGKSGRTR